MRRKIRVVASVFFIIGLIVITLLGTWVWWYQRGFDPKVQAKRAVPVIKALNAFKLAKGKYPAKPSELSPFLPSGITAMDSLALGYYTNVIGFGFYGPTGGVTWHYDSVPYGKGYSLSQQLRDDWVSYEVNGDTSAWIWYRGDGVSDPVKLNITP